MEYSMRIGYQEVKEISLTAMPVGGSPDSYREGRGYIEEIDDFLHDRRQSINIILSVWTVFNTFIEY